MTAQEKQLYNTYLATTRSQQNKPFTLRKDFEGFEKNKEYPLLARLATFLKRYPHIKAELFFKAPYDIYPDTEHLPLSYYLTRAAIKAYSLYQKKIQDISPDLQIEDIRKSFQYIGSFCIRNNIQLHEYLTHKSGCVYSWMFHYKEHHTNIYSLFEIGDLSHSINQTMLDEKTLLLDDLQQSIVKFKVRYYNSIYAKKFVKEGTERIKKFLANSLTI